MRWNPTLFYLERVPGFILGAYWGHDEDAIGWPTWNLVICFGIVALRIERGIVGGK